MEALLKHAWFTGTSSRVLRYMGRPIRRDGQPYGNCPNEVMSRVMAFHDGVRVRHWVDHNSVEVYNEQNVLRVETTMNNPYMFKVYRRAEGEAARPSGDPVSYFVVLPNRATSSGGERGRPLETGDVLCKTL